MIFIWRRSGIAILGYLALSFWIVSFWFTDTRLGNSAYLGWSLFYAAIGALIHSLLIVGMKNISRKEDTAEEQTRAGTIWSHSLFYIPVLVWPFIFGGISAYNLIPAKENEPAQSAALTDEALTVETRTIHFLNCTADSMIYRVDGPDGTYAEKTISPQAYATEELEAGKYNIIGGSMERDIISEIPAEEFRGDKSKCESIKDAEGTVISYRIIRPATPAKDDYDEAWVILDGAYDMMLVDVSAICSNSATKKEIENIDWTKNIIETYSGKDIIEPVYGKYNDNDQYTILDTGSDIPKTIGKNEHVFALFSISQGADLTSENIRAKVLSRFVME